jgi:hypothetical protein
MTPDDCPRQDKWFGCRWHPRYSYTASTLPVDKLVETAKIVSDDALPEILDKFRDKKYECEVCARCGMRR